jgi:hypothetical protein
MNFAGVFFFVYSFYYILNFDRLMLSIDKKIEIYSIKNWIIFDLIYYLSKVIYPIWIVLLLFTQFINLAHLLILLSFISSIFSWIFGFYRSSEIFFTIIKIILLFLIITNPTF